MPRKTAWEKVGQISVDAGICWLGDPCYILQGERPKSVGKDWKEFCEKMFAKPDADTYQFSHDLPTAHPDSMGVVVNTGIGDGLYDVEVKRITLEGWGERIAEVRVVFIP